MSNEKLSRLYSLFYIILIGALGSGVWDLFLKDFLYWIGEVFVNTASSLYEGYFDRLYENVGKNIDILIYLPSIFLMTTIILSPLILYTFIDLKFRKLERIIDIKEKKESTKKEFNKFEKFILNQFVHHRLRFKFVLVIPMLIPAIMFFDSFIIAVSDNGAIESIERRLDIVRPYISENRHNLFVSELRLIDSRDGVQNLIHKLEVIAKDNKIEISEIKLYGIESLYKQTN